MVLFGERREVLGGELRLVVEALYRNVFYLEGMRVVLLFSLFADEDHSPFAVLHTGVFEGFLYEPGFARLQKAEKHIDRNFF